MTRRMIATYLFVALLSVNVSGCAGDAPRITATINQGAAITGDLPANPLRWKVITSMIDKRDATMSTLYGNDLAVLHARSNSQHDYPDGAALSLVTWSQREDDRWYGAKIPNRVRSVEFVFVSVAPDGHPSYTYAKYEGAPLQKVPVTVGADASGRASYLLAQRAAVMP